MIKHLQVGFLVIACGLIAGSTSGATLPSASLSNCQSAVKAATQTFVSNKVSAIGGCLQAVSTQVVKNNKPDASAAGALCVTSFRRLYDSRGLGKQLSHKLAATIAQKCAPGQPGVTHTLADILGSGAGVPQPLHAQNLSAWCSHYGGDGSINSVSEWIACVSSAAECAVDSVVAAEFPRVLEWLNLAQTAMLAVAPPATDSTKVSDAIAALAAVKAELDPNNDDVVSIQCGSAAAPSCTDGIKNGSETDIDCGDSCPPCGLGAGCAIDGDCQTGVCNANLCSPAGGLPVTCLDGLQDGDETGKDCGGSCVSSLKCGDGGGCLVNGDCQSDICNANVCAPASAMPPPPSCFDGLKDFDETGKDCGGSCVSSLKCGDGGGCLVNGDCQSGLCNANVCAPASAMPPPSTCGDGMQDGDETGKDCGGSCVSLLRCGDGLGCLVNNDCQSGLCNANVCAPSAAPTPNCFDYIKNNDETGVDCGGSCLVKCADGLSCMAGSDCQSGLCNANVCSPGAAIPPPFTCVDGFQDGDETGIDCGGSCASAFKCGGNVGCMINGDCQSGFCFFHLCAPSAAPAPAP